ncbi:MFS transporter [Priestia endophytica]|uniref:MFS transporter n=1 Tax=Priestia endophytica TaxID=135735 RepID=UPI00203FC2D8|nr:MFS transporter [Priestia endophytica]MCM3537677.1 MFS transporter [Priestia endophytica]
MGFIQKGTAVYRKTNFSFFAAGFNTFAILYCMQPLLPHFTEEFHITPAQASLALSLSTISLAIGMLIFGSLSEAWGRKPVMVISMIAASVICILTPFSPNFHWLLILRTIEGISLSGLPSIAMAYLGEEIEPKSLGSAMGLYICGNAVGATFGRVIVGLLTEFMSWQWAVLIVGIISFIASVVFWRNLPNSKNFTSRPLKLSTLTGSLFHHLKDPGLLCLFGLGFLLLGSNVALFNYIGYVLVAPPFSLSQSAVSWIFLLLIIGMFSSAISGRMIGKYGRRQTLIFGLFLLCFGAFLTINGHLVVKLVGLGFSVYGFFSCHSIASSWVGKRAAINKAQASSLYLFLYYTGSSVGGTVGGVLWPYFGWEGVVGLVLCFVLGAFLLTYFLIKAEQKAVHKSHEAHI